MQKSILNLNRPWRSGIKDLKTKIYIYIYKKMPTKEQIKEREKIRKELLKEKAKKGVKEFNREVKKALNTAIMAAFGFLIALVWKDVITNFVENLSERSPFKGALLSALLVTVICVLGIMILSRVLKDKEEKK